MKYINIPDEAIIRPVQKNKIMKEKIENMIAEISAKRYDNEDCHGRYDSLIEEFVLNYDKALLPLMRELINLEKDFWHA